MTHNDWMIQYLYMFLTLDEPDHLCCQVVCQVIIGQWPVLVMNVQSSVCPQVLVASKATKNAHIQGK